MASVRDIDSEIGSISVDVGPHRCDHCQVPVRVEYRHPHKHPSRIQFPQTVQQAQGAAQDGCLIFNHLNFLYKKRSFRILVKSHVSGSCPSCHGKWTEKLRHVMGYFSRRPFSAVFESVTTPSIAGGKCDTAQLHVSMEAGTGKFGTPLGWNLIAYTHLGDIAACILPTIDTEVESFKTTSDIKDWLKSCNCTSEVQVPSGQSFRPTRIVDIGGDPGSEIVVRASEGLEVPAYVCFSYCWGGPQALVLSSAKTTAPSFTSLGWKVSQNLIPAAFKDVFKVARQLGFRYIWIDSLCIAQDNPTDLEREILAMPSIFMNASLTICASVSSSCRQGFLHRRVDREKLVIPLLLDRPDEMRPEKGRPKVDRGAGKAGQRTTGTLFFDFDRGKELGERDPAASEPLGRRAWAYQERLLSPRILEYGWRTVRWSCYCTERYGGYTRLPVTRTSRRNKTSSEVEAVGETFSLFAHLNSQGPRRMDLLATADDGPEDAATFAYRWSQIVTEYSRLEITFTRDRLAAIGAIAAKLREKHTPATRPRYLAGLWDGECLPYFLLWQTEAKLSGLASRPGPEMARAPSWSWVPITMVEGARILGADVEGGFGLSATGSIRLQAPTYKGINNPEWSNNLRVGDYGTLTLVTILDGYRIQLWPDCIGELFVIPANDETPALADLEQFLFVAITQRAPSERGFTCGLILKRGNSEDIFHRVGMFQLQDGATSAIRSWERKISTIV